MSRPPIEEQCVLVVEDDPSLRELVALALEDEGYTVETAEDGAEALVKACADPPDAIILDLHMPVMDGRDFIAVWSEQPADYGAPILAMSAGDTRLRATDLGVRAYLPKPFDLDALLAEVRDMLRAA